MKSKESWLLGVFYFWITHGLTECWVYLRKHFVLLCFSQMTGFNLLCHCYTEKIMDLIFSPFLLYIRVCFSPPKPHILPSFPSLCFCEKGTTLRRCDVKLLWTQLMFEACQHRFAQSLFFPPFTWFTFHNIQTKVVLLAFRTAAFTWQQSSHYKL